MKNKRSKLYVIPGTPTTPARMCPVWFLVFLCEQTIVLFCIVLYYSVLYQTTKKGDIQVTSFQVKQKLILLSDKFQIGIINLSDNSLSGTSQKLLK